MKILLFTTGRGMGGDAVISYNILKELENRGIDIKLVLDPSAQGLYFKKHDLTWLVNPIPAAGGHAASKKTLLKAAIKSLKAVFRARTLIKKENVDAVIGVNGGGAVIACLGAKIARIPAVGVVSTPTDTKISLKCNDTIVLPESPLYLQSTSVKTKYNIFKSYIPISSKIAEGNKNKAIEKLSSHFDSSKPSFLFSSGSTLFEDMALAARKYAEENNNANIYVIGTPLNNDVAMILEHENIIHLGYINWINDLYELVDLVITTDDGATIHETLSLNLPIVVVLGVKYGRYHNLASLFTGAVIESHVDNISETVNKAFKNKKEMKDAAALYAKDINQTTMKIGDYLLNHLKK